MLRAGSLRRVLLLQAPVQSRATDGGDGDVTWTTEATIHAEVRGLSGREYYSAAQSMATTTHRIITRYSTLLSPGKRLVWTPTVGPSRVFNIASINDMGGGKESVEMQCVEVSQNYVTVISQSCGYTEGDAVMVTVVFTGDVSVSGTSGTDAGFQISADGTTWMTCIDVEPITGNAHSVTCDYAVWRTAPVYWRMAVASTRVSGVYHSMLVPQSGRLVVT